MSDFCVIDDAEELLDEMLAWFPQPMTYRQAGWLDDMLDVLEDARSYAVDWQEDKEVDEEAIAQREAELVTAKGKLIDMKDELDDATEERRTFELEREKLKPNWRLADDPFKEWYDEARLKV